MQYIIEIPASFYTQEIHDFMKPYYETGKLDTYPQPPDYEMNTIIKRLNYEGNYKGEAVLMLEISFNDFERSYDTVNKKFMSLPKVACTLYEGEHEGMPALKHYIMPSGEVRTVQENSDCVEVIEVADIEQIIKNGGDMTDIYKLLMEKSSLEVRPIQYYGSSLYSEGREKQEAEIERILRLVDEGKLSNSDAMDKIREIRKGGE